jgi:DNA polymerase
MSFVMFFTGIDGEMKKKSKARSAEPFLPARPSIKAAKVAVQGCRGCDLYKNATQAVFGEGSLAAKIVVIGEVPGDREDREGHPFVGPAGHLLEGAFDELGVSRKDIYVTNAVKHFKWVARGKRRLHQRPNAGEVKACRPWLDLELALVKPKALICLGATAAYAVFGKAIKIGEARGKIHSSDYSEKTIVTTHPSALLRMPDKKARDLAYAAFLEDLSLIFKK